MEGDLIEKWKQQMVLEQRRALASSYSVLKLDFLTEQLFCESQEKALEMVQSMHWRFDASTNMVYPVPPAQQPLINDLVSTQLQENSYLIEQASKSVSFFEQKVLKAEASKDRAK